MNAPADRHEARQNEAERIRERHPSAAELAAEKPYTEAKPATVSCPVAARPFKNS
jgi:hypothetical protein